MAAINVAGFDDQIDSPTNHPLRQALRQQIAARNLDSVFQLKRFFRDHRKKTAAAELSQYVSYALLVDGPPRFEYRFSSQSLPPDVDGLEGLTPLLVAFYREANIHDLWMRVQPYYDQAIEKLHEPVSQGVLQVNSYLRNPTSGFLGRTFQIYVDLLGPPNQIQTRSYADDYFVVVTPGAELPTTEIRHGYLHYLADPLVLKFSTNMKTKSPLGDYALGSPLLDEAYKSDFILLSTECFIKAVEARIDNKPAAVTQAMREGFVLTPAFADLLGIYEKQEVAMRLYFPDLVAGIDFKREEKRLDHIDFVSVGAVRTTRVTTEAKPIELSGAAKTLDEGERAYAARNLELAQNTYLRVLRETGEKPMHAKAYYGLARISVLQRDPETADRLFRKVLELEPDADTKSWSLLYLARLADAQGDREQAIENYKAALAVEGVPTSVRQAAEKELEQGFQK